MLSGVSALLSRLWLMPWRQAQARWALGLSSLPGLQWALPHYQGQSPQCGPGTESKSKLSRKRWGVPYMPCPQASHPL